MKLRRLFLLLTIGVFSSILLAGSRYSSSAQMQQPMMAKMLARKVVGDKDNYNDAGYSFKYGINGEAGVGFTHGHWDIEFGNGNVRLDNNMFTRDTFSVNMIVGDCSRIKDLGEHKWSDEFKLPELPAFSKGERENPVQAIVGHMYLVHTKQWDWEWDRTKRDQVKMYSDYFTLVRVESLEHEASVTISWKLNSEIKKIPVEDKDTVPTPAKSNP